HGPRPAGRLAGRRSRPGPRDAPREGPRGNSGRQRAAVGGGGLAPVAGRRRAAPVARLSRGRALTSAPRRFGSRGDALARFGYPRGRTQLRGAQLTGDTGQALRATSDALLRDLEVLATIEEEKRSLEPGDPRLVQLAARIEEIAQ